MSNAKSKSSKPTKAVQKLTCVLGNSQTLPGESAEEYQQGLNALIEELEAKTVMQVYLAEKIFECLWWMRRYEQQKRATIAREMARIINYDTSTFLGDDGETVDIVNDMEMILDPDYHKQFIEDLEATDYTEQALIQEAFANKSAYLSSYNDQIAVLAKNLSGFQASYEVLSSRKLNLERLRMQNELLSQDLKAIEMEPLSDENKPPKKSRK